MCVNQWMAKYFIYKMVCLKRHQLKKQMNVWKDMQVIFLIQVKPQFSVCDGNTKQSRQKTQGNAGCLKQENVSSYKKISSL